MQSKVNPGDFSLMNKPTRINALVQQIREHEHYKTKLDEAEVLIVESAYERIQKTGKAQSSLRESAYMTKEHNWYLRQLWKKFHSLE
ncbi:Hypothetical protein BRZCDTV_371 [Brazilian cedratvirus IHUMI]|uniref:Uncharacterized protein n=1 Tax=Brazilian cedratvirus IHUMI TaxID=2126980 RepID=A0A2R8FER1_9VIRU|nr:Hypothetical protein BRZCDTV_371 [Brazilian cedratvirus IHUMI]